MNEAVPTAEIEANKLSVELAQPQDAEDLAQILSSAVQNKITHGDMAWGHKTYTSEELRERIEQGNTYIAWLGELPVATLLLIWDDPMMWGEQPPIAAYVHQLAVKHGYRGNNLGQQLLDWAGQQAANHGRELLRLDFPPENEGLRSYYEKLGFKWVRNRQIHTPRISYTAALYERPANYNSER